MDEEDNNLNQEEEDAENFFLQPASSPYNIKAKIISANEALLSETVSENKEFKVKFTDNFIYYEPHSDRFNLSSIESEDITQNTVIQEHPKNLTDQETLLEVNLQSNLVIQDTDEEDDISEELSKIKDEDNESSIEDLKQCVNNLQKTDNDYEENIHSDDNSVDTLNGFEEIEDNEVEIPFIIHLEDNTEKKTEKADDSNDFRINVKEENEIGISPDRIICRRHCIDRFDSVEEKIKKKIPVPSCCPMLKLRKRNCCERNEAKKHQKLPVYTGKRSEYGMSAKEIREAKKKKAIEAELKLEEMRIIEENRRRKIEENEKIFIKWLQNVSKRKKRNQNKDRKFLSDRCYAKNTNNKIRPNTAGQCKNEVANTIKFQKKKRPQTCPANICIEIPPRISKKGIIIGDVKISTPNRKTDMYHLMEIY